MNALNYPQSIMDQNILRDALQRAGLNTYDDRGQNPTTRAQAALSGRTHYADPDTLRFHKGRITSAQRISMGAFFLIVESCAVDYENTRRTFRAVCFDIFGKIVYRPDLDSGSTSNATATTAFYKFWNEFNEVAYYQETLHARTRQTLQAEIVFNQALQKAAA